MYSDLEDGAHGPAGGHAAAQTHSEGGRNPPQQLPALVHRPIGVDSQGLREQLLVGALDPAALRRLLHPVLGDALELVLAAVGPLVPRLGDVQEAGLRAGVTGPRSEEHTSDIQSQMRTSYA